MNHAKIFAVTRIEGEMEVTLREKLMAYQKERQWSDLEMADFLKIERETWRQIRTNDRRMSGNVLRAVSKALPEFYADVLGELARG